MKNLFYTCAAMLGALALTAACSNDAEEATAVENQQFTITATMDAPDTRTTVATEKNKNDEYDVLWSEDDQIFVFGGTGDNEVHGTFTLTDGSNSTSGTFMGGLSGNGTRANLQYAIYPLVDPVDYAVDGSLYVTLPSEYTYAEDMKTNSPMWAVFETEDKKTLAFQHLCGMVRARIIGIETTGVKTLALKSVRDDKDIWGSKELVYRNNGFDYDLTVTGKNTQISYTIPENTPAASTDELVFDFPVWANSEEYWYQLALTQNDGVEKNIWDAGKYIELKNGDMYEITIDLSYVITGGTPTDTQG